MKLRIKFMTCPEMDKCLKEMQEIKDYMAGGYFMTKLIHKVNELNHFDLEDCFCEGCGAVCSNDITLEKASEFMQSIPLILIDKEEVIIIFIEAIWANEQKGFPGSFVNGGIFGFSAYRQGGFSDLAIHAAQRDAEYDISQRPEEERERQQHLQRRYQEHQCDKCLFDDIFHIIIYR